MTAMEEGDERRVYAEVDANEGIQMRENRC
jgi:hypothetical protein